MSQSLGSRREDKKKTVTNTSENERVTFNDIVTRYDATPTGDIDIDFFLQVARTRLQSMY